MYFSGYGNGVYDPNDVNFPTELTATWSGPIWLNFQHAGTDLSLAVIPTPTLDLYREQSQTHLPSGTLTFEKAQTFQIFSPGIDGLYGVGGQFISPSATNSIGQQPAAVRQGQYICGHQR